MKTFRHPWMILLLAAPILAGCLGGEDGLPVTPLDDFLTKPEDRFDFTWPDPVTHDGAGAVIEAEVPAEDIPHVVQTRLGALANNPHIVASEQTGSLFVVGQHEVYDFDHVYRSTDQGQTWEPVLRFVAHTYPDSYDYMMTLGATVGVDPDTGRVFASHIHPDTMCTYLFWSDADGEEETWQERPLACNNPIPQPCWRGTAPSLFPCGGWIEHIGTAPVPSEGGFDPGDLGTPYPNLVFSCRPKSAPDIAPVAQVAAQAGVPGPNPSGVTCAFSNDGGENYLYETQALPPLLGCDQLAAQPAVFPDGTIAVPRGSFEPCLGREPTVVAISSDGGITWSQRECTGATMQREMAPSLAITPDGTAYLLYRDENHTIRLARSTDQFETCDVFQVSPPGNTLNVFTALGVGADGHLAMAYLGTEFPQDEEKWVDDIAPAHAVPGTEWHLFVTTSTDADSDDPVFVTQQVTPWEDPIQLGCIFSEDHPGLSGCSALGQRISLTRDSDGRFYVALAEGCLPRIHCSGDPWQADYQTRERGLALAILDSGPGLFGTDLPSLGLVHPEPYPRAYGPQGDEEEGPTS